MSEDARFDSAETSAVGDTAGNMVYGELLNQLLMEEEATKASLEQRGLAVVSTAGALVTLLFGVVALTHEASQDASSLLSRWLLLLSVISFVIAGILGILTNSPMKYEVFGQDALSKVVQKEYWNGPKDVGAWRVARLRVSLIKSAREQNAKKARRLRRAVWAGGLGITYAAFSVVSLLFQ